MAERLHAKIAFQAWQGHDRRTVLCKNDCQKQPNSMSQPSQKRRQTAKIKPENNMISEGVPRDAGVIRHGSRATPTPPTATQLSVALYIEEMSQELAVMARAARLDGLAYFIDMTRLEAEITRRRCEAQQMVGRRTQA
ncbi:MAG TPA: hypothetical protein VGO06_21370 [Bosea sp. (in: a-proteobacteria)]|jgi:hypothetical protein|uniref:hypothetical protein n=1 Tax=Bosea sp. (in: a-proteobacteria) TaxID=1871050 RepID=UPI002E0E7D37|nr:hypothetical protein [Bosea sp. (in: a-proteobacteria)]